MAFLDATIVNVALPRIGADLDAGLEALQWTVNAYTLTLASLILLAGVLGDRFGRRRVFLVGVVWFAAASAVCGSAPNAETLVVARALQGVGGALLTPGSLAILQASFVPEDRARAIGAWSGLRDGGGRRAAGAGKPRDPAGVVGPRGPGAGARRVVGAGCHRGGRRPAGRRRAYRRRIMAFRVPAQPAARRRRPGRRPPRTRV